MNIRGNVTIFTSCCGEVVYKHLKMGEPLPTHVCFNKRYDDRELSVLPPHYNRKDFCGHGDDETCKCGGNGLRRELTKILSE